MALRKRDKLEIYANILLAVYQELRRIKEAKVTRVQYKVGVPFDRFKGYVEELKLLGFVENEAGLRLTPKGREFLQEYSRLLGLLNKREEVFGDADPEEWLKGDDYI
ncbi:MAG: winged helix-turn-helix domain-containing protein [Candidatus Bathyarchaeia archaeon]